MKDLLIYLFADTRKRAARNRVFLNFLLNDFYLREP